MAHYGRSEELVAASRLVFAVVALLALGAQAVGEGAAHSPTTTLTVAMAVFYALGAAVAAFVVQRPDAVRFSFPLATHVTDILVAAAFTALTPSATSPLFHLFTFVVFSATLRFTVRGVIATGAAASILYAFIGLARDLPTDHPGAFATRVLYLILLTALLAYLRREQQRRHEGLLALATWPRGTFGDRDALVHTSLQFARSFLKVDRAVIVFEESEEPWVWMASWDGTNFRIREDRNAYAASSAPFEDTFFCPDIADARTAIVSAHGRLRRLDQCPIDPRLVPALGSGPALSAPLLGREIRGRLYLLGRRHITVDDLSATKLAAELFATSLDEFVVLARERSARVIEERLRLGRDLHDTLLQSFTAMRLQLEAALSLVPTDREESERKIRAVQELIAKEQGELREFITSLRQDAPPEAAPSLASRLWELPLWCLQQWDIIVSMHVVPPDADVPEPRRGEIYRLVNETLANAAKHSRSKRVDVEATITESSAKIEVRADGAGFPFEGTFDLAQLRRDDRGPRMVLERIAALGGNLILHSSSSGIALEMEIPLR